MHIIILGAGELGRQLAWTLSDSDNKVVVVDESAAFLERIKERLDVMTVQGDCASFGVLKRAGVARADLLVGATGSDAANVLGCQIARHFNVSKTICRLSGMNMFSEQDGFPPSAVGIDHVIFPQKECVAHISSVLKHKSLIERLTFDVPEAEMVALRIDPSSSLCQVALRDFPDPALREHIRFSALIREQEVITPHGDTVLEPGDEVYVAGDKNSLNRLMELAAPGYRPASLVIVAGITAVGKQLIRRLLREGYNVRVIENNLAAGEQLLDDLPEKVMIINGDPTESDVLEEAGVPQCDAFISTMREDEDNILSCILSRKLGAVKAVTVTNKAEYMDIVPAMTTIDTGFSPRVLAVNAVLNLLGTETARVHAILHRLHAYVYEFEVQEGAPLSGKKIADYEKTPSTIFSLFFRGEQLIPATGDVTFQVGDRVAVITTPQTERSLEPLFRRRRLFSR